MECIIFSSPNNRCLHNVCTCIVQVFQVYIMHQSIPAAPMPPPPRANPRALGFFFSWKANSPGVGTLKLPNDPRWGRRKRANAPPPGWYVPNQHCSSFHSLHINATFSIKCVIFRFCRPSSSYPMLTNLITPSMVF